jgi:hypothetical protein
MSMLAKGGLKQACDTIAGAGLNRQLRTGDRNRGIAFML